AGGAPLLATDRLFVLQRNGYAEECYFDVSCSAIRDGQRRVRGVFVACSETTQRVLGARRLAALRDVATATADARRVRDLGAAIDQALASHRAEVPFARLYVLEDGG